MYFDSHAHLTEDCFAQDFDTIVENMKAASVTGMMEIGFDLPSSEKAVRLACPTDRGRISSSFCRASTRRPCMER